MYEFWIFMFGLWSGVIITLLTLYFRRSRLRLQKQADDIIAYFDLKGPVEPNDEDITIQWKEGQVFDHRIRTKWPVRKPEPGGTDW